MCHVFAKTGYAFSVPAGNTLSSSLSTQDCASTCCVGTDDPQLPSGCQGCHKLQLCSVQSFIAFVVVQAAQHMEWVDDVQMFMRKGAATPVAYQMAAPLLADIASSLQVCLLCRPRQTKDCASCTAHRMAYNNLQIRLCLCVSVADQRVLCTWQTAICYTANTEATNQHSGMLSLVAIHVGCDATCL